MNPIRNQIEASEKKFDKKFGKNGPDADSDSIGIKAGCDDCSSNIFLRGEHKNFLHDSQYRLLEKVKEWADNQLILLAQVEHPDEAVRAIHASMYQHNPPDLSSSKIEALGQAKVLFSLSTLISNAMEEK